MTSDKSIVSRAILVATEKGIIAVDARIRIEKPNEIIDNIKE